MKQVLGARNFRAHPDLSPRGQGSSYRFRIRVCTGTPSWHGAASQIMTRDVILLRLDYCCADEVSYPLCAHIYFISFLSLAFSCLLGRPTKPRPTNLCSLHAGTVPHARGGTSITFDLSVSKFVVQCHLCCFRVT